MPQVNHKEIEKVKEQRLVEARQMAFSREVEVIDIENAVLSDTINIPEIENEVLRYWGEISAFEQQLEKTKDYPRYVFFDGPPFATGLPHYGHILAGIIKDTMTRYASQTGHFVPRKFGWDCHGLPVEYEIDKQLEIKNRLDIINKIGIANYNEQCRSIVMRYRSEWVKTVKRMGRWIDFENDYKTLDMSFMESVWWVFKQLYDKNLVYTDYKVMPYSTVCCTPLSNFEASQNYKDISDPAITVAFRIEPKISPAETELIAWTTTPWTLPANVALCLNPEFDYSLVLIKSGPFENRMFWILGSLVNKFLKDLRLVKKNEKDAIIPSVAEVLVSGVKGIEFEGLYYEMLFDYFSSSEQWKNRIGKVIVDSYVTDTAGTGIVHNAPAFGEDDARVCLLKGVTKKGEASPCHVDESGCFTAPITDEMFGMYFRDTNKTIKNIIKKLNRLILNESIVHSCPHCWRSDSVLMYKAVSSWFVDVAKVRDTMILNNGQTHWVPKNIQDKRFHNWISDAKDWCISRNRFWGTPIPLWISQDKKIKVVISSVEELQKHTNKKITDIHRHFIDEITIKDPRGDEYPPLKRIEEVFDCWFESGSMPYAQCHYPFENQELFKKTFPADFIGEGLDQTRGWFYTLSIIGAALFAYNLYNACSKLTKFFEELTNWYVRFNRDRMRGKIDIKQALLSLNILFYVIFYVTLLMSPFSPFFSEYTFQILKVKLNEKTGFMEDSVHFCQLPKEIFTWLEFTGADAIELFVSTIETCRSIRDKARIPVKACAKSLVLYLPTVEKFDQLQAFSSYIKSELNAFNLEIKLLKKVDLIYSLQPVQRVLGKKLGTNFKGIEKVISELSQDDIDQYLTEKTLEIEYNGETYVLTEEDVTINKHPKNIPLVSENSYICNDELIAIFDFTQSEELVKMNLLREIVSAIQKLRKDGNLSIEDQVKTVVEIEGQKNYEFLAALRNELVNALRRDVEIELKHHKNKNVTSLASTALNFEDFSITISLYR
uniref:isoleucine--tRNA ligase n=1 Tax=Dermatophagoides pteronyssinus TaxID=6956 RepID=A0A6P6XJ56_DERPT|nr:isoleucine--tRNA ligase-like [Dermatophagoides pteronyssinus]